MHPSSPLKWAARLARALLWAVVGVWLAVGLAWGTVHIFIVPRIGDWRAELEDLATRTVGVPVRIGRIAVHTQGLVPSFELTDVRLLDAQGRDALVLGRVVTAVSARSLLRGGFEQIHIAQPTLDVRRTTDERLLVAGLDLLGGTPDADGDNLAADWFFSQTEFAIQSGTVRWTDDLRAQAPVSLADVDLVVRNPGRRHLLRLDATPQDHLGQRFTLQAVLTSPFLTLHPGRWQQWSGTAYADLPAVDMARLAVPTALTERFGLDVKQGAGALRMWVDVSNGQPTGGTADLALNGVLARFAQAPQPLALAQVHGRVNVGLTDTTLTLNTEGLAFDTAQGLGWTPGDLSLKLIQASGRTTGELRASRLNLAALHELSSGLPLAPPQQAQMAQLNPQGELSALKLGWRTENGTWSRFAAQGKVVQLALAPGDAPTPVPLEPGGPPRPLPGRPGLAGATVDFDLNQDGGKARVSMGRGWLSFPGVFEEPHIPIDLLTSDVHWQIKGPAIRVQLPNLRFANADLQGQANAQWRTSDPRSSPSGGRLPGVLKLEGTLSRGKGERVHRYVPLVVGPTAQAYVKAAIHGGKVSNVRFRAAGDLWQMPFATPADGVLKVVAQISGVDFAFIPPSFSPPGELTWPALKQVAGELVFDRTSMALNVAKAGVADAPGLHVSQGKVHIANLLDRTVVEVAAQLDGPLAQALGVVRHSPLSGMTAQALTTTTGTGNAGIQFGLSVPLYDTRQTQVKGRVTLPGNDVRLGPDSPLLARTRGVVEFSETGFQVTQASVDVLGGELSFTGGLRADVGHSAWGGLQFAGQGKATAAGLAQAPYLGLPGAWLARASGSTSYAVQLAFKHGLPEWTVQSTLQGLALSFPAPMQKSADQEWNLHYQNKINSPAVSDRQARDTVQLTVTPDAHTRGTVTVARSLGEQGPVLQRGVVSLGPRDVALPPLPPQGLSAHLNLPALDADAWLAALETPPNPPAPLGTPVAANPTADLSLSRVQLDTDHLRLGGRSFQQLSLSAQPVPGDGSRPRWRAQVQAKELAGTLTYLPPHATAPAAGAPDTRDGQLVARLQRMALNTPKDAPSGRAEATPTATLPALDVVVEAFQLDGRDLGQLTLDATNRATGPQVNAPREWLLHRLVLQMPEAQLHASGTWSLADTGSSPHHTRRTALRLALSIEDTGALLRRFGMPGVFRGGQGRLKGDVDWLGSPTSLHTASLSGQLKLDLASGQFLKADPGLAKLLGVLSLQSLPRRLTLDFRDVFTDGFAFDFVRGDARIEQGVVYTNNLQMKGPNAVVLMEGQADIARETQHIRAVVVPELNAGTASLIATVINPAVGLGTFLAQALLRQPLIAVSSQSFLIHGPWADPQVDKISTAPESPANPAQ